MRLLRSFLLVVFLVFGSASLSSCYLVVEKKVVRYIRYNVVQGDSLRSLSRRFNVSLNEIVEINQLDPAKHLHPGQFVKIPYRGQNLGKQEQKIAKGKIVEQPVAQPKSVETVKLSGAKQHVGKLLWPVDGGGKISSVFGRRWLSFHEGLDIAGKTGTRILAAHDGEVVYSGSGLRGYGNLVVLKGIGILTVYAHNDRNRVKVGDKVRRGAWIADLGSTGKSTGPHLHFETRVRSSTNKNVAVDPMAFFP